MHTDTHSQRDRMEETKKEKKQKKEHKSVFEFGFAHE